MSETVEVFGGFKAGDTLPNGQCAPKGWRYCWSCHECPELAEGKCENVLKPCQIKKEHSRAEREANERRRPAWGDANWGRFMWGPG